MEHNLINTIVISIICAFLCGLIANRLKFPPIIGYLIAGIMVGPFTPGFIADASVAQQLAEIGIILLMFGVGLHFSISDLLKVRKVAVPGALFQMGTATVIGWLVMHVCGVSWMTGLIYGFSLSVASTVVLIRALEMRGELKGEAGKIAVGWLIVEDMAMVLALVLFPTIFDMSGEEGGLSLGGVLMEILIVVCKISVFVGLMVVFGKRVMPWVFVTIAKTRSSELTTLGTLAVSMGFAFVAYTVFDASFALGAFLAGLMLSESEIGRKAAEKSLPMRDAFAVLFFVSVGMLFNPMTIFEQPVMVFVTLLIIVLGKSIAALMITSLFRQTREVSQTVAISLAQIGEFSFVLAGMGLAAGVLTPELYSVILAGALLSIALNPFLFKLLDMYQEESKVVPAN